MDLPQEDVPVEKVFATDADALQCLHEARELYAQKQYEACVEGFSPALMYFSERLGEGATRLMALAYYEYGVALLRIHQDNADLLQDENIPGAKAAKEEGEAAGEGEGEGEEEEEGALSDLHTSGAVLQEAQKGFKQIVDLAATTEGKVEVEKIFAEQVQKGVDCRNPTALHQLAKSYLAFSEVLHEMNNYELSAAGYALAAGTFMQIENGEDMQAVAKSSQGLELKYCEQYEDARTVLLEAKALMLSLGSDVHTDRLQAVQDVLDEIDMDYAAVKKVAGEQVRGTCDGVAVTKDTPQEKRASGPVTVLQPRKKRKVENTEGDIVQEEKE